MLKACAIFFSLFVGLFISEVTLRLLKLDYNVMIGWTYDYKHDHNEFDFRGRLPSHKKHTILLIGDSEVVADYYPLAKIPEVQLETFLEGDQLTDYRVMSVAASGWGQDQQLLAIQNVVPKIKPDYIVAMLTYSNDLWNNTFPTNSQMGEFAPKPTFWLESGVLKGPNLPWRTLYHSHSLYLLRLVDAALKIQPTPTDQDWEKKLPAPYQGEPVTDPTVKLLAQEMHERIGGPIDLYAGMEERENYNSEKNYFSIQLYPASPRKHYSIELTQRLIGEIKKLAENYGGKFLMITPLKDPKGSWPPTDLRRRRVGDKVFTYSMAEQYRSIEQIMEGVPHLIYEFKDPKNIFISAKDLHLNDQAIREFMQATAQVLSRDIKTQQRMVKGSSHPQQAALSQF